MKTVFSQPESSRKKGRPRVRWLDSVLKDLKTSEVWKKTRYGELWSETISEAKAREEEEEEEGEGEEKEGEEEEGEEEEEPPPPPPPPPPYL
jgi:hypothetical protein